MARAMSDEEANELVKRATQKSGALNAIYDIPAENWLAVSAGLLWGGGLLCFIEFNQPIVGGVLVIGGAVIFACGVKIILNKPHVETPEED